MAMLWWHDSLWDVDKAVGSLFVKQTKIRELFIKIFFNSEVKQNFTPKYMFFLSATECVLNLNLMRYYI